MDDKIISMLLQRLVDKADEVDGNEVMSKIKPLEIEDANAAPEKLKTSYEVDDGEDDDDSMKIIKLFK